MADSSRKAGQEGIEGLHKSSQPKSRTWSERRAKYVVSTNYTVDELQSTNDDKESHEDINQLDALRGVFDIAVPDSEGDCLSILRVADGGSGGSSLGGCRNGFGGLGRGRRLAVRRVGGRRGDLRGCGHGSVLLGSHVELIRRKEGRASGRRVQVAGDERVKMFRDESWVKVQKLCHVHPYRLPPPGSNTLRTDAALRSSEIPRAPLRLLEASYILTNLSY